MIMSRTQLFLAIVISVLVSYVLLLIPLPPAFNALRPAWPALVIIFWVLMIPERINIVTAWFVGLTLDLIHNALLGEHALALALLAYLVALNQPRLRLFPMIQQSIAVLLLLYVYQLAVLVPQAFFADGHFSLLLFLAPVIGALVWPWVQHILMIYVRFIHWRNA